MFPLDGPAQPGPIPADGAAADAIRQAEAALARQNSVTASVDLQVVTAVLNARAVQADGASALDGLQREIEAAVATRTDLDTPAGAREFQRYLLDKLHDIRAVVEDADLDDTSRAALAAALAALYATSDPAGSAAAPPPPPDPVAAVPSPPAAEPGPPVAPPAGPPVDLGLGTGLGTGPDGGLDAGAEPLPADPAAPAGPPVPPTAPPVAPPVAPGGLPVPSIGGLSPLPALPNLSGLAPGPVPDRPPSDTPADSPPAAGDPAADDSADSAADPADATARPGLSDVIAAAVAGTAIPDAFAQQGITIPDPGTPLSAPLDPAEVTAGDVGVLTDRHALALGNGKALLDNQIQPIEAVNRPGFLGWMHPPAPHAGAPSGATAVPPEQPASDPPVEPAH